MSPPSALTVGLIGYGAIGRTVAEALLLGAAANVSLTAILCRDPRRHAGTPAGAQAGVLVTDDAARFFGSSPDLVIEAAGQDALRQYGVRSLEADADLLISSIGAFADDSYFNALLTHAERCGKRLRLASGALPAVDWMRAASLVGVTRVAITQAKPVASWRGTPAAEMVDLDALEEPFCFFQGNARQAAGNFPKSSNITAMLALCTAGMEDTEVSLVADPVNERMVTHIEYEGAAGSLRMEWQGVPSLFNPSTSADVPLTIVNMVRNLTGPISYGA